jgi:hypothetical protein
MNSGFVESKNPRRPRGVTRKPTLPGYHSEEEQAERLGMRRWRAGTGPKSVRCGRQLYPHGGDEKWLNEKLANAQRNPTERGPGRPRVA